MWVAIFLLLEMLGFVLLPWLGSSVSVNEGRACAQEGRPIDTKSPPGGVQHDGPIDKEDTGGVQRHGHTNKDESGNVQRNPNQIGNTPDPDKLPKILKKPELQPSLREQLGR